MPCSTRVEIPDILGTVATVHGKGAPVRTERHMQAVVEQGIDGNKAGGLVPDAGLFLFPDQYFRSSFHHRYPAAIGCTQDAEEGLCTRESTARCQLLPSHSKTYQGIPRRTTPSHTEALTIRQRASGVK